MSYDIIVFIFIENWSWSVIETADMSDDMYLYFIG